MPLTARWWERRGEEVGEEGGGREVGGITYQGKGCVMFIAQLEEAMIKALCNVTDGRKNIIYYRP